MIYKKIDTVMSGEMVAFEYMMLVQMYICMGKQNISLCFIFLP